jgi:hypothetical protein
MIANNEMPWKMKDGVWTKIKGQLARAYAPYGAGGGGKPDILDNSGNTNAGKASTKPGPAFGGQQTAVVAGGTGWQKRWGWFSKIPGLGGFKNITALLQQDIRPLDWIGKNRLGTMIRVGMPDSKNPRVRQGIDKWIPKGMTGT